MTKTASGVIFMVTPLAAFRGLIHRSTPYRERPQAITMVPGA
jgi:hypothetical protein